MLPDSHMHTEFSGDSTTPVEEMVETAIRLGMNSICVTDHHDPDFWDSDFLLDADAYWKKMRRIQETYRDRIQVRIGVEIGLQAHLHEEISQFIQAYPYDFVIGSMHLVDGIDPYERDRYPGTDREMYRRYFEDTLDSIRANDGFQSLGHLDYIVRYGWEREKAYSLQELGDIIDEILKELVSRQIALEINTGGYKSGIGFPNPHPEVLRRYRELGGELVTLGADAHVPSYIGYEFDRAVEVLKNTGFSHIAVYTGQKAEFIAV